jgi:RNA 2',3'-cyclic 3'-phosphodiesterase
VRVFFALWPDEDLRVRIACAAAALHLPGHARRVPPKNFHLTLAFLGEVSVAKLAVLLEIGRDQRAARCTLNFETFDYWPEPKVVVALASETPPALIGLSTGLHQDSALHDVAHIRGRSRAPPGVPLRAHVTLARKVTQAPVLQAMSPLTWSADSFSLVRSDTSGLHSVYTVVDTWPLLDETPTAQKSL